MIEVTIEKGKLQEIFLQTITKGKLSNREYSVLTECCKDGIVTTEKKREIQKLLNISQYSFNNVASKLIKDGFIVKFGSSLVVPEIFKVDGNSVIIKLKEHE